MKLFTAALLLSFTCGARAQLPEVMEVVKVDSARSASELFLIAQQWFSATFNGHREAVQFVDSTDHILVAKGATVVHHGGGDEGSPYLYGYSVEVITKQGRYRYRIYNMNIGTKYGPTLLTSDSCCYRDTYDPILECTPDNVKTCVSMTIKREELIASLKAAMANQSGAK